MRFFKFTPTENVNDAIYKAPVEAIAGLIQKKDKEFNEALDSTELDFKLRPHLKDSEKAKKIRQKHEERMSEIVDEAYNNPVDTTSFMRKVKSAQRDITKDVNEGHIYNINKRNEEIIEHKKQIRKLYMANPGDYKAFDNVEEAVSMVDHIYQGYLDENGDFTTSPNLSLQAREDNLKMIQNVTALHTGMDYSSSTEEEIGEGLTKVLKTKYKGLTDTEIRAAFNDYIKGSKSIQNSLQQQAEVKRMKGVVGASAQKEKEEFLDQIVAQASDLIGQRQTQHNQSLQGSKNYKGRGGPTNPFDNNDVITTTGIGDLNNNIFREAVLNYKSRGGRTFEETYDSDPMIKQGQKQAFFESFKEDYSNKVYTSLEKDIKSLGLTEEMEKEGIDSSNILDNVQEVKELIAKKSANKDYSVGVFNRKIKEYMAYSLLDPEVMSTAPIGSNYQWEEDEYVDATSIIKDKETKKEYEESLKSLSVQDANAIDISSLQGKIKDKDGKLIVFVRDGESEQTTVDGIRAVLGDKYKKRTEISATLGAKTDEKGDFSIVRVGRSGQISGQDLKNIVGKHVEVSRSVSSEVEVDNTGEENTDQASDAKEKNVEIENKGTTTYNNDTEISEAELEFSGTFKLPKTSYDESYIPMVSNININGTIIKDVKMDASQNGLPQSVSNEYRRVKNKREGVDRLSSVSPGNEAFSDDGKLLYHRIPNRKNGLTISMGSEEAVVKQADDGTLSINGKTVSDRATAEVVMMYVMEELTGTVPEPEETE